MTITDSYLKHQINIGRFSNYEARKLLSILDQATIQAKNILEKTNGIETKAKFERVQSNMRILSDMFNKKLYETIESDFKDLAKVETQFVSKVFKASGIIVNLDMPPVEKIWAVASFSGYADTHKTFKDYADSLGGSFYETWDRNVRAGYMNGLTVQQINKQVMGSVTDLEPGEMKDLRKSLKMNTRTMVASMATMARNETYKANSKLFSGYRYVGVLDDRQCLICGSLDQTVFETLEDVPELPAHRQCRCVAIPEVKGMEGFDDDDERASMDGPVSAKMSYSDWLAGQDDGTQKDILGAGRYDLYKNGMPITKFVDNGSMIPLKDLENS